MILTKAPQGGIMKMTLAGTVLASAPVTAGAFARGGESLFKSRCQPCHGPGGKGTGIAPALAGNQFVQGARDQEMANSILKGRQGADRKHPDKHPAGMPPQKLSEQELTSIVAYMKSLQGK